MNEHEDDLESRVQEDAEEETDTLPITADEFDRPGEGDEPESDAEPELDEDPAEL